jgi:hypothetical protein
MIHNIQNIIMTYALYPHRKQRAVQPFDKQIMRE